MASDGLVFTAAPDLPSTGLKVEVARIVKDNIRQLLVDALADKVGHAMALAAGKSHWRELFMREMGAFWGANRSQGDHMADVCYDCLDRAWKDQYPGEKTFAFLDSVHIASPKSAAETEREIDDAWEVEIAGSEEAMRKHYYGSARVRRGRDIFSSFWQKDPSKATN